MSKHEGYYDNDVAHQMSGAGIGGFGVTLSGKDKEPNPKVPEGVCQRCEGHSPGWGPCRDGITGIVVQDGFGEVRCGVCSRCDGTGKEPPPRPQTDWSHGSMLGLLIFVMVILVVMGVFYLMGKL